MSDRAPELRIVEDLWRQLSAVDAARDRDARRSVARGRAVRVALVAVLILLAVAAVALAASQWLFGSPAPSSPALPKPAGPVLPGTARLLSLRVADPSGGPPWGLRVAGTAGGLGCVQAGRVVDGRLVTLGIDDSFGNDGRAHPLPVTSQICGGVDDRGNPRVGGSPSITTGAATTRLPACQTPNQLQADRKNVAVIRQILRHPRPSDTPATLRAARNLLRRDLHRLTHPIKPCPPSELRTVIMGALGPAARRVTLSGPARPTIVETLRPGDEGGYLFVLVGQSGLRALRMSVRYSNGLTCPTAQPFAPPSRLRDDPPACRRIPPGYVYSRPHP